ncbi:hypothetical protein RQP46_011343 [Phenoliferia psychrophenolica]
MSVNLTPSSTLTFQRPLTQLVKQTLTIQNTNSSPIAFKVKTTAPKQYCVRPNSGRVEAGESCQVQVLLQPMKEDPAPGTKCRDKFLVQSVIITPEREASPLTELWSAVEKEDKAGDKESPSIKETKIRCMYLAAADDGAPVAPSAHSSTLQPGSAFSAVSEQDESKFDTLKPSASNGAREVPAADAAFEPAPSTPRTAVPQPPPTILEPAVASTPPSVTPPPPSYATPTVPAAVSDLAEKAVAGAGVALAGTGAALAAGAAAISKPSTSPEPKSVPVSNGAAPIVAPAVVAAAASNGDSRELATQLATAQAEIKRLQAQLAQAETTAATLRSRGAASVPAASTAQQVAQQQKAPEGVPLQVVAGLCFGVFVVTWLFF